MHAAARRYGWDLDTGSPVPTPCTPLLLCYFSVCVGHQPYYSPFLDTIQQPLPTSRKPSLMPPRLNEFFLSLGSHNALHISPHSRPSRGILLFWFVYCLLCWILNTSVGGAASHTSYPLLPSPASPYHPHSMQQPAAVLKTNQLISVPCLTHPVTIHCI